MFTFPVFSEHHASSCVYIFRNQEMAAGLKSEVTKRLRDLNVFNFSMMIVKVGWVTGFRNAFIMGYWKELFTRVILISMVLYCNQYFHFLFDFSETMLLNVLIYLEGNNMSLRSIIHSRYFSFCARAACVFD